MSEVLPEALPDEEQREHTCPECGQQFKLAMHLGAHRARKHGVAAATPKRKRRAGGGEGSSRSSAKTRRRSAVASTLRELADLSDAARGRSTETPEHLADVIRRDAEKIAATVAAVAERLNPVAWFVDVTMGPSGILTLAVGLSGVGRWLLSSWRAQLEQRGERQQQQLYQVTSYCGLDTCEIVHPHEHRPEGVFYL